MQNHGPVHSRHGVEEQGLSGARNVYWNLPPARLYEEAVRRGEARISADGALICHTGEFTGRSPNDKFVVEEPATSAEIWWGKVNKPISGAAFDLLLEQGPPSPRRQGPLRLRRLRRRRSALSHAGPGHHRDRLAGALRLEHVRARDRSGEARPLRARLRRARRGELQGRSGGATAPAARPSSW